MSHARPPPLPRLTLRETLDILDLVVTNLASIMSRWQDGVAPELRAEIMLHAHDPLLRLLLRARRRPLPR
jgi:hypothetical protein